MTKNPNENNNLENSSIVHLKFTKNSSNENNVYLEKQKLLFCAIHAVNNLV
jgi:hypothetical protein